MCTRLAVSRLSALFGGVMMFAALFEMFMLNTNYSLVSSQKGDCCSVTYQLMQGLGRCEVYV